MLIGEQGSQNPYLSFIISNGASGDTVTIKWLDNLNQSSEQSVTVS